MKMHLYEHIERGLFGWFLECSMYACVCECSMYVCVCECSMYACVCECSMYACVCLAIVQTTDLTEISYWNNWKNTKKLSH